MEITEEQKEQFKELTKPLMLWLEKNFHPHVTVIIDFQRADLTETIIGNVNR